MNKKIRKEMKRNILTSVLSGIILIFLLNNMAFAAAPKDLYVDAQVSYEKLKGNYTKKQYRENWIKCIENFNRVYKEDKNGPWAAAGLYMTGLLYEDLFGISDSQKDRRKAIEIYEEVISGYPKSNYKKRAEEKLARLCKKDPKCESGTEKSKKPVIADKTGDSIAEIIKSSSKEISINKTGEKAIPNKRSVVNEIRYWSNPSYTRIVIDADYEVPYEHHLLKKDPLVKKPSRLYIDLSGCKLRRDIKKIIPIDDNLLSGVRAGQYTLNTVRVVVDIKSFKAYKIFPLREPFRIVVDVWGVSSGAKAYKSKPSPYSKSNDVPSGALAKQFALGVRRVVIDPGHGGKDPGAEGYLSDLKEKDLTLKIAKRLAKKIKDELNLEVVLTRTSDRYLTLEERTAIANTKNADLFLSVHANAHKNPDIYGIETFYLNLATDDDAILVAARENATSTKNISDLHSILSDLMQNAKINESSRLATFVQESLYFNLNGAYDHIRNNGVKQAPFYVLLGAQMPAVLVETSFISNPREC